MTQRTNVQSMELAVLAISATLPATYDAGGYGATTITYTACGQIENFGSHGLTNSVNTFTPVDTGITFKTKGSKDYGKKTIVLGDVPVDAGQVILLAASESKARYSAKVTYPLGEGESTPEIHYLDVLITKYEHSDGAVNDIRKATVDLEICRKPVIVAAT